MGVPGREQLGEAFSGRTRRDCLEGALKKGHLRQHTDGDPEGGQCREDFRGSPLLGIIWGSPSAQVRASGERRGHESGKVR